MSPKELKLILNTIIVLMAISATSTFINYYMLVKIHAAIETATP